jgi:aldehyde:ferredoxin oxidoreductase
MHGYNQKIARIDLTAGNMHVATPDEGFYRHYLGGRGFIIHTLMKEMPANIDPLGPENRLVFASGPLTGHFFVGSGRHSVGSKSPLTGAYGESEAGGYWGAELKRAGYDALIIQGAAAKPVYLWIDNGKIEIHDASFIWGLEVAEAHHKILERHGGGKIRTALIGPAGEKRVNFACILHDITHAAGRTGIGAVMGSKNLKAIAVKGDRLPPPFDRSRLIELNKIMLKEFKERTKLWQYGTGRMMEAGEKSGNLPIRNFKGGRFPGVSKLIPQVICANYLEKMAGCFGCPIRCKRVARLDEPYSVDPVYGCPEYETLASFGSNCGIDDLHAVMKANELCNRYGLDTLSTGGVIAFAMECFENRLLTIQDTGGLDLSFGNAAAMLQMIEQIATLTGLGALLAKGTRYAAQKIGKGAERYAMQVKGEDIPMHEPRYKQLLSLHYSIHATGADHNTGPHDVATLLEGCEQEIHEKGFASQLVNSLGLCRFVPWEKDEVRAALKYVTGWEMSEEELQKVVDRGVTLAQLFNLREGLTSADYKLPERFTTTPSEGALRGIDPVQFDIVQKAYYKLLGWDENGVPTRQKLKDLDIMWAESKGVIH